MDNLNMHELNKELANFNCHAEKTKVNKNNTTRDCIRVQKEDSDCGIILYGVPETENGTMREIAEAIKDIMDNNMPNPDFLKSFLNKDFFLENVLPVLTSSDENNPVAQNNLSESVLDMTVLFKVFLKDASLWVEDQLIKNLGITNEQLHDAAFKNLKKHTHVTSMRDMLLKSTNGMLDIGTEGPTLLVATNDFKCWGASVMLQKDLLDSILSQYPEAERLIIIPSSVHECIIVPDTMDASADTISIYKEMVMDINATEVAPEDKLTDSLYYYTKEDGLKLF